MRSPLDITESSGKRSGRKGKQGNSCQIFRARRLEEITYRVRVDWRREGSLEPSNTEEDPAKENCKRSHDKVTLSGSIVVLYSALSPIPPHPQPPLHSVPDMWTHTHSHTLNTISCLIAFHAFEKSWKSVDRLSQLCGMRVRFGHRLESCLSGGQHCALLFSHPFPIVDSTDH